MFGIDTNVLILVVLVLLAAGSFIYAFLYQRIQSERQYDKRFGTLVAGKEERNKRIKTESQSNIAATRRQNIQSSLNELEEKARAKDPNKRGFKDTLRQAGLEVTIGQFYIFSAGFGIVFSIVVFILSGNIFVAGASLVIGALGLPRWYVNFKRKRRMNAFLNEFPNAVDVITRGIKAGLPLNDCMGIIASEAKEPVKTEFKRVLETQQLGVPMTEAVMKLYKNVPLAEANFFCIVISIQQTSGGNLSEALGNLSKVLRDRKKMKAKIVSMSSEAKASAGIIGSLPVIVTLLIYLTTPAYISILFTDPTGHMLLIGAGLWMLTGIMVMRSMINFNF